MRHKKIYEIPEDNKLVIKLPEAFRKNKRLLVIIDDSVDDRVKKIELLKAASNDPAFLQDIEDIENDFKNIDSETL